MNRAAALAYLQNEYADMATEAGLDTTPLLQAYNTVIDQSLRGLEYPEAQLGTTDVPVSGAVSASQSEIFGHVHVLRDMAEKRLAGLGYSPTQAFTSGRFTLDFLEPSQATGGMG